MIKKYIVSIFILLSFDLITKYLAWKYLNNHELIIINDVIELTYYSNDGISFGMFGGQKVITILLPILLIPFAVKSYQKYMASFRIGKIASIFFLGGSLGNMGERIFSGKVTDFIDVKNFAIINLADIYISISLIVLFVLYFVNISKQKSMV